MTQAGLDSLAERHKHLTGHLDYWTALRQEQMRAGAATNYVPADVSVGDLVSHRHRWYPVVRVNPKSVTLPRRLAAGPTPPATNTSAMSQQPTTPAGRS